MKLIDKLGREFKPGLIAEVPTGNLLWVDAVNGNDTMGLRGGMTSPFRTLTAAKEAAVAGDTIVVLPGVYTENNLLRHLVNWHFMNGAKVEAGDGVMFDTGASGTNGAVTCRITGHGHFSSSDSGVLSATIGSSDIYIEALRMFSGGDSCVHVGAAYRVIVRVLDDMVTSGATEAAVSIEGGTCVMEADTILSSGSPCIEIAGGNLHLAARYISSSTDNTVEITGGAAQIHAADIRSFSGHGLYHNASGASLIVVGARIVSDVDSAVWFEMNTGGTEEIRLRNCLLISATGYPSVDATVGAPTPQIQCANVWANAAVSGNITTPVIGDLEVHVSLS